MSQTTFGPYPVEPVPVEPPVPMPTEVRIGSVTYRVTVDPDEWMRMEHRNQHQGDYGHTQHSRAIIYVEPQPASTTDVQRLSLWHEVLHALCETAMGSPNWRHLGKEPLDREETIIRAFESPTLLVLRDNPHLAAYLTAGT